MATSEGWDMPTGDLMKGKKGLIMGVANSSSIAWGIASQLAAQGAELAFTYLGEGLERRVRPLAESVGAKLLIQADVTDDASMDKAFEELEKEFGTIDFVVHSVAFANKDELAKGRRKLAALQRGEQIPAHDVATFGGFGVGENFRNWISEIFVNRHIFRVTAVGITPGSAKLRTEIFLI